MSTETMDRIDTVAQLVLDILRPERPAVAVYALALVAGSLLTETDNSTFTPQAERIAAAVLETLGALRPEDLARRPKGPIDPTPGRPAYGRGGRRPGAGRPVGL